MGARMARGPDGYAPFDGSRARIEFRFRSGKRSHQLAGASRDRRSPVSTSPPTVAFTIDLEPDCPPFLRGYRGIEHGLPRLLDMLRDVGVPATFFTTGEVARRYP